MTEPEKTLIKKLTDRFVFKFVISLVKENRDNTEIVLEAISERKGFQRTVLDLEQVDGSPTGKFIICCGRSTTQVGSIADNIQEQMRVRSGEKPLRTDGYRNSQWIVLDYGDMMVHVFLPEARQFYDLEGLWSDAPRRDLPEED